MPFDSTDSYDDATRLLIAARALLMQPGGWCKRVMFNDESGYCASGAINAASKDWPTKQRDPARREARRRLVLALKPEWRGKHAAESIIQWNDWSRRRKQHVIAAFDRAIAYVPARMALAGAL